MASHYHKAAPEAHRASAFRLVAVAFVLLTIAGLGQSQTRVVRSPECPYDDDEVLLEISGLRVADKEVSFDAPFEAKEDWLASLVFRVVNRGNKPIAGIMIRIGLLDGVDEELPTYASYDYGVVFMRVNRVSTRRLGVLVEPGKEIEITSLGSKPFGLQYMDAMIGGKTRAKKWTSFASSVGSRFHRAEVLAAGVLFTDGTEANAPLLIRAKCDQKK